MTSKISIQDAIAQLKQMFASYDDELIASALKQTNYDMTNTIELLLSYSNDVTKTVEIRGQETKKATSPKKEDTPPKQKQTKGKTKNKKQIVEKDEIEEIIQFNSKLGPCKQRKLYYTEEKVAEKDEAPIIFTAHIPVEEKKSNN